MIPPESHLPSALVYAQRFQWPVFPVHGIDADGHCTCGKPTCSRPGKHPIGKLAPRGFLDATFDPDLITRWWTEAPLANIGIPTGLGSGFIALDIATVQIADRVTQHG